MFKWIRIFNCILLLLVSFTSQAQQRMTLETLQSLVEAVAKVEEKQLNYMQFVYKEVRVILIGDKNADRMRFVTPIIKVDQMETQDLYIVMESNYHQALDARYATSNGVLYSVYVHPLSSLNEDQVFSALNQVTTLALTYGTHYSSGELNFGDSLVQPNEGEQHSKSSL